MGSNPSRFSRSGAEKDAVKDVSESDLKRFPVDSASWDDAQGFVGKVNLLANDTGWSYRLPKRAEWEYACRGGPLDDKAGSAFDYYFAKPTNDLLPDHANFALQRKRTCKVGTFRPNALGLYDMHGHVFEWCEDGTPEPARFLVGGAWTHELLWCRAAVYHAREPTLREHNNIGLRLARVPWSGTTRREVLPGSSAKADDSPEKGAPATMIPRTFTNSLGMEFVLVPKGKSWLGLK